MGLDYWGAFPAFCPRVTLVTVLRKSTNWFYHSIQMSRRWSIISTLIFLVPNLFSLTYTICFKISSQTLDRMVSKFVPSFNLTFILISYESFIICLNCNRILCNRPRMLWDWEKQRADYMSTNATAMSKQESICILGCISPNSSSEHLNGKESIYWKSRCCLSNEHSATCQSLITSI